MSAFLARSSLLDASDKLEVLAMNMSKQDMEPRHDEWQQAEKKEFDNLRANGMEVVDRLPPGKRAYPATIQYKEKRDKTLKVRACA